MRKPINREHIEGYLYEHNLALKTVQNTASENYGKPFIGGTVDIQTDEEGINIITVNFTYVTEVTSKGTKNSTFTALKSIIDNGKTVLLDGKENATMLKIDTALGLNDFYTSRDGEETLVSAKRNEGGFVTIVSKLCDPSERNKFEFDMLINKTNYVEKNEEKHIDADYLTVGGAIFNFRNAMLPVSLVVKNPGGIKYFESLDVSSSNLVFTKVWGNIQSQVLVEKREEESAFGEPTIKEFMRTVREWVLTGAAKEPYEIDDEKNGITKEEITKAQSDREVYLADVKKRQDEYQASKASGNANANATQSSTTTTAAAGGFNF